ncbi:MAG: hypothetical protein AABX51_02725 [Nanoarchaeota archaeon]
MYSIFRTQKFDKELLKQLSLEERNKVVNFEKKQLVSNPHVGDPLGYKFFREKKVGGKRIYFLIYEDVGAVLMVAISDKKTQQETIDQIRNNLNEYYSVIKEAIKQHGGYGRA